MRLRTSALAAAFVFGTSFLASAQVTTQKDVQEKLEKDGYTQVRDIKFGVEAITAKAVKDGKEWLLVIDSSGKVLQQK